MYYSDSDDERDDEDYVGMKDLETLISSRINSEGNFTFSANPVKFRFSKDVAVSKKFISTVANSNSTIRMSLKDRNVEEILNLTSSSCAKNFFRSVEDIWCCYVDSTAKIRQ